MRVGITSLTIAHRLTTVQKCDRVIVLERGRIVEMGSPSELMIAQGVFYRMVQVCTEAESLVKYKNSSDFLKEQAIAETPSQLAGYSSHMATATSGTDWDGLPSAARHRRKSSSYAAKINVHALSDHVTSEAETPHITMGNRHRVDRSVFFQGMGTLDVSATIPEATEPVVPPVCQCKKRKK